MKRYYVYILRCSDDTLYTGITSDLPVRLHRHDTGAFPDCYTVKRRPVRLVYTAAFGDVHEAIAWERRLKRWSRKKKEDLIYNEGKMLRIFACMAQDWEIAMYVRKCRFLVMVSLTNHRQETIEGCRPSSGSG